MKKQVSCFLLLVSLYAVFSCDNEGTEETVLGEENPTTVVISGDGTTSNGSRFVLIDENNFYLDYVRYTIVDGHLVVSGYERTAFEGEANIFHEISFNGSKYEVLAIADKVFERCFNLRSVVISNGVKTIGVRAFYDCPNLRSVTIPRSIANIKDASFGYCNNLSKVFITDLKAWCGIHFPKKRALIF